MIDYILYESRQSLSLPSMPPFIKKGVSTPMACKERRPFFIQNYISCCCFRSKSNRICSILCYKEFYMYALSYKCKRGNTAESWSNQGNDWRVNMLSSIIKFEISIISFACHYVSNIADLKYFQRERSLCLLHFASNINWKITLQCSICSDSFLFKVSSNQNVVRLILINAYKWAIKM